MPLRLLHQSLTEVNIGGIRKVSTDNALCDFDDDVEAHVSHRRLWELCVEVRLEDRGDVSGRSAAAFVFICCLCKGSAEEDIFWVS